MSARPRVLKQEEPAAEPVENTAARPLSRARRDALLLVAIAGVVLVGVGAHALLTRGQEWTDNAHVEADVVPLSTRVSGPVLHVLVEDNTPVRQGQVLVEIDPREYSIRVEQAEAELASAEAQAAAADAQLTVAEAGARGGHSTARALVSASVAAVSGAQAQVDVARAALARAEAEAHQAALEFERVRQLADRGVASQAEFEVAQTTRDSVQAALVGARAQLAAVEQSRQSALSRVAEAEGQLAQSAPVDAKIAVARATTALAYARKRAAEAVLAQARLMLEQTRITAPADGRMSRLTVRQGQSVSAGQPVAQLVPRRTYVVANFKETQVGHIRPGQRVEVTVDSFPDLTLAGRVESVSGGTGSRFSLLPPDNASGNFVKVVQRVPVRIAWTDLPENLPLQAGLSVEVTVFTHDSPAPPEAEARVAPPPSDASK